MSHWYGMMFLMMKDAIRRAEAALDDVLALCKSGDASAAELRRGLGAFKSMRAKLDACQTHATGNLAARERHGDGGAGVLTKAAGLSRPADASTPAGPSRPVLPAHPDKMVWLTGLCRHWRQSPALTNGDRRICA